MNTFSQHEKGMQLLIAYLYLVSVYGLVSGSFSIYEIIMTIRESVQPQISSPGEPRFYSPGRDQPSIWTLIFNMAPIIVVTNVLGLSAATGLLYSKSWGWWLSGVYFIWGILTGIGSLLTYIFVAIPGAGQTVGVFNSGFLIMSLLGIGISITALWYLFTHNVQEKLNVRHRSVMRKMLTLAGGVVLTYVLIIAPGIPGMLL